MDTVEIAMKHHALDLTTKAMALIALLKLSSRFPSCSERIREIIIQYKGNLVLELQQRSIEFSSIITKHQNIRSTLLERMPVLDEATFIARRAGSLPDAASTPTGPSVSLPNGVAKPVAPLVDLLDLSSDDAPAPSSSGHHLQDLLGGDLSLTSQQPGATQPSRNGTDVLLDLLSIGSPSASTESPFVQSNSSTIDGLSTKTSKETPISPLDDLSSLSLSTRATSNAGTDSMTDLLDGFSPNPPAGENHGQIYPSITAFESSSLRLTFNFSKQPGNSQTTNIQATFMNLSSNTYTDFVFQGAVPKFLQLQLYPASGNTLPANGKGSIMQNFRVTNSLQGKKSLVMRIRITYKLNGNDTMEEGQISNFPRDL